jgi:hypothetical protein
MSKFTLTILLILFAVSGVLADGNHSLFEASNANYSNGKYDIAIEGYEQILQTGQESPEIYYNLANSYFKMNQLSKAILYYERGLLLAPGDEDIQYNLSIANELITDKIEALPEFFIKTWYKKARNLMSSNSWALVSLISFVLSCFMTVVFILTRRRRIKQIMLPTVFLALIICALSITMSRQQSRLVTDRNTCIVFAPSVTVKSSPDNSGTDLFVLHEGLKLEITERLTGWFEIKLADGNVGWIKSEAVEII